jgi:hypothetical protein
VPFGADDRQVPAQDINELWQAVDARRVKKRANSSELGWFIPHSMIFSQGSFLSPQRWFKITPFVTVVPLDSERSPGCHST